MSALSGNVDVYCTLFSTAMMSMHNNNVLLPAMDCIILTQNSHIESSNP